MFQGGVSGQNGVVRFNHCCCNLRCWVDSKLQFGFLAIVNRQTLHEQRCEARTRASTKGVEDKESLQASALVCLVRIEQINLLIERKELFVVVDFFLTEHKGKKCSASY